MGAGGTTTGAATILYRTTTNQLAGFRGPLASAAPNQTGNASTPGGNRTVTVTLDLTPTGG